MIKYKCPDCGGMNVQGKHWVELNSNVIQFGVTHMFDEHEDDWCPDCHAFIVAVEVNAKEKTTGT